MNDTGNTNMKLQRVSFRLNGAQVSLEVLPDERLVDTLRWRLGVFSVKLGCGKGECGTCIVIVNGKPKHSCLTLTASLDGSEVTTLEGIASDAHLHAIQLAYVESKGIQCGFCVPGFIMTTKAMIELESEINFEVIREWLASVLCRCGSYLHYIKASQRALNLIKEGIIEVSEKKIMETIEERNK